VISNQNHRYIFFMPGGGEELTMHKISGFMQILYPSFLLFVLDARTQAFDILVCNEDLENH
jgi:hypothetical protein